MSAEEAFPRGGGRTLTGLERKRLRQEAEAEAERDFAAELQGTGKKQKTAKDSESFLAAGKLPDYVEVLRFKKLSVGAKIWGVVSAVHLRELAVSLPHGLRGQVTYAEASDAMHDQIQSSSARGKHSLAQLSNLFHVGQFVRAVITSLGSAEGPETATAAGQLRSKGKQVALSLRLSRVQSNQGVSSLQAGVAVPACVGSIEDHGYLMDFGIKGAQGFLAFDACDAEPGTKLQVGQLLETAIVNADNAAMLHVTAKQAPVASALLTEHAGLDMGTLLPGMLVNARVRRILQDGLVVSFLMYFHGSVDVFHLREAASAAQWAGSYRPNQRLKARVLYVDPSDKRICLSLKPHLLSLQLPAGLPVQGTIVEDAVVMRVDNALGATLELPPDAEQLPAAAGEQPPAVGFAHVSSIGDKRVERLDKALRIGKLVKARVMGSRPFEGIASVTLKPSVVDKAVEGIRDLQPGGIVSGSVSSVEEFGLLVALTSNLRGLVPWPHTTNLAGAHARRRIKPGHKVTARILDVKASTRRVTLTLKRALLDSKLPLIASLQEAKPGLRSHGTVTGVQEYGVFIGFYGSVSGLAPTAELGLAAAQKPADVYELGQVVKATVLSADPEHNRLRLSLASATAAPADAAAAADAAADALEPDSRAALQPGSFATGVISSIVRPEGKDGTPRPPRYIVNLSVEGMEGTVPGQLEGMQLSDHPVGASALQDTLQVGDSVGKLLVLESLPGQSMCRVSRKALLIAHAAVMPCSIEEATAGSIVPGVVSNVTLDSVFVRFLGGFTGRAGLTQLADTFVSSPAAHFSTGQTVRALLVDVDSDKGRVALNLRPSATATPDAGLLASLFCDLELADALRAAREPDAAAVVDWSQLKLGAAAAGRVHELQPYGVLYDLDAHPDLVGLITTAQQEGAAEFGQVLSTRVLDINKKDGIIDLTTKQALTKALQQQDTDAALNGKARKKRKRDASNTLPASLKEGQKVEACVELVKDDYLVLSLPEQEAAIGCAGVAGFNQRSLDPHARFRPGQRLPAILAALSSAATGGRLLLHVPLTPAAALKGAPVDIKDKRRPFLTAGTLVKGTVVARQALSLDLQLPQGLLGQQHITQVQADACTSNPLDRFTIGDSIEAVCIGPVGKQGSKQHRKSELSVKPALIAAASDGKSVSKAAKAMASLRSLKRGSTVHGFVEEVTESFAWVTLAPGTRARLHALDSSVDTANTFAQRYHVGQPLTCRVIKVDKAKGEADLSHGSAATAGPKDASQRILGTIVAVSGQGVRVRVSGLATGTAALTDLHDGWVPDALAGFSEGQSIRAVRLPSRQPTGRRRAQLQLSLKPSLRKSRAAASADEPVTESSLKEGQQVQGYVKSASRAGVFVVLSRQLDARVRLSNLADSFVAEPEASFPPGKHVRGWIVSVEPGKVEMTLKQLKAGWHNLDPALEEGSTVRGRVKTVEGFGVFVQLLEANVTGMAHVSELADDFVKAPADLFKAGQGVRAKILKLDRQQQRLSLALKPSYFEGDDGADLPDAASDDDLDLDADMAELSDQELSGADLLSDEASEPGSEESNSGSDSTAGADETASDPPGQEGAPSAAQGVGWGDDAEPEPLPSLPEATAGVPVADADGKSEQQLTKRRRQLLKRREEEATHAAEQARLADPAPGDTIALEKAIAARPNSSLAWIQAMAFHISTGELAAARALAQRALDTIHFREEAEKRNIWVAWLNLEAEYGEPHDEAVMKLFHRALPYNDPKKLYFSLLEVLQKAKLERVLQETLKAVMRRFSGSCKAWLAQIRQSIGRKELDSAQKLLERALSSLPQRKHIKVLSHAALLHFKEGSHEQGRNLLEKMIRNFPKRLDLWNVYLDQEVKLGDPARVRALFSRATHAEMPVKKMRSIFKRFLEYEQAHGNAQSVASVQAAAQAYVDEHMAR